MRVAAACLEEPSIVREHKVVLGVDTPEERDATISVLHLNMALQLKAQASQQGKVEERSDRLNYSR